MENDIAVRVRDVSMYFTLNTEHIDNLKEYVIKLFQRKLEYESFHALENVSIDIKKGDRVGILGLNGAGKSTLLKIIAGVMKPTAGTVELRGDLVPLLELGAGFDKQYTGSENIYLYGAMLGYSKELIDEKYDEIVRFARLKRFMDVPIKNYSSGMRARLGFAIATIMEPDILILDEVLAVGDARFRRKCIRKLKQMFAKGTTVLFVSHSTTQVRKICNRAILLEGGKIIADGDTDSIISLYEKKIEEEEDDDMTIDEQNAAKKRAKKRRKRKNHKRRMLLKEGEEQ